jgi:hypothetical protein
VGIGVEPWTNTSPYGRADARTARRTSNSASRGAAATSEELGAANVDDRRAAARCAPSKMPACGRMNERGRACVLEAEAKPR